MFGEFARGFGNVLIEAMYGIVWQFHLILTLGR